MQPLEHRSSTSINTSIYQTESAAQNIGRPSPTQWDREARAEVSAEEYVCTNLSPELSLVSYGFQSPPDAWPSHTIQEYVEPSITGYATKPPMNAFGINAVPIDVPSAEYNLPQGYFPLRHPSWNGGPDTSGPE